jgi:hypothetical protein
VRTGGGGGWDGVGGNKVRQQEEKDERWGIVAISLENGPIGRSTLSARISRSVRANYVRPSHLTPLFTSPLRKHNYTCLFDVPKYKVNWTWPRSFALCPQWPVCRTAPTQDIGIDCGCAPTIFTYSSNCEIGLEYLARPGWQDEQRPPALTLNITV